jgi:uncharacterized membrane protein YgdD (TMEM256/DUF423 family)
MVSVALGAFGAHALKSIVSKEQVAIFETGVRYQFLHAIALIALSLYGQLNIKGLNNEGLHNEGRAIHKGYKWAAIFFIAGVFMFSGSLYLLTFRDFIPSTMVSFIGPITPLGGVSFIAGWMSWLRVLMSDNVDK